MSSLPHGSIVDSIDKNTNSKISIEYVYKMFHENYMLVFERIVATDSQNIALYNASSITECTNDNIVCNITVEDGLDFDGGVILDFIKYEDMFYIATNYCVHKLNPTTGLLTLQFDSDSHRDFVRFFKKDSGLKVVIIKDSRSNSLEVLSINGEHESTHSIHHSQQNLRLDIQDVGIFDKERTKLFIIARDGYDSM